MSQWGQTSLGGYQLGRSLIAILAAHRDRTGISSGSQPTLMASGYSPLTFRNFETYIKAPAFCGFAELQRIGLALSRVAPFDVTLSDSLRDDLGDWRLQIDWSKDIFTDIVARTQFYERRGLDWRLTDFPAPALNKVRSWPVSP